ncbi:MAG TPA: site-specific DNA-methyltransferase, partial [Candidatus Lokiarchaeia archaeon]|nr:site-specific DNA-methyltransferase [Candidatus Lokiarchaeia archaeon]
MNRTQMLTSEIATLNQLLSDGLGDFTQGNLNAAAGQFRKIARNIKQLEEKLFTAGTFTDRNTLNDLTGTEWLRYTKSWFVMDGKAADIDEAIENHPGSFPPELAAHFIKFFTKQGQMIIDPFMGIGSTFAAAADLGRQCIGVELNPEYADYARRRVPAAGGYDRRLIVHTADARQIQAIWKKEDYPPVNLCITSPPYWNMLGTSRGGVESTQKQRVKEGYDETYSTDPRDLGNIDDYEEYVRELSNIFVALNPILQDGAHLVIILQNCRPKDGV